MSHHLRQGLKLFSNRRIVLSHLCNLCLCCLKLFGEGRIVAQDPRHSVLQRAQARRQHYKLALSGRPVVDRLYPARCLLLARLNILQLGIDLRINAAEPQRYSRRSDDCENNDHRKKHCRQ